MFRETLGPLADQRGQIGPQPSDARVGRRLLPPPLEVLLRECFGLGGAPGDTVNAQLRGQRLEHDNRRSQAAEGDCPAKVTLGNIYDVEAPEVGDVRWDMSAFKAYRLDLHSEQKAFAFSGEALEYVTPSAEVEFEDEDHDPNRPARDSFAV